MGKHGLEPVSSTALLFSPELLSWSSLLVHELTRAFLRWVLNHDMLDHDFSQGRRAGIAIINIVFIFGNALTELGANVVPFGADFMSLFPRWLNIKRGMWLCYILGVCTCPWQILATATGFLKFLNGYSIFLGPFLGMALTDYLVVGKGNVFVKDLYKVGGRY